MWPHDSLRSNQVSALCGPTQHTQCLHAKFVPKAMPVLSLQDRAPVPTLMQMTDCRVMHTLLFVNQLRP